MDGKSDREIRKSVSFEVNCSLPAVYGLTRSKGRTSGWNKVAIEFFAAQDDEDDGNHCDSSGPLGV